MTLDEARALVGHRVLYQKRPGDYDRGVIEYVTEFYVFVRYEGWPHAVATDAELLIVETP